MPETNQRRKRVCIVVLGDIGRSPRIQFHALSLAKHGYIVDLVGYEGSKPHNELLDNPDIFQHFMTDVPNFGERIPKILNFVFKVLWRSTVLFGMLLSLKKPDFTLVQNPPSIPTLPVVWFYCKLRGSKFVIDWHNYSYTILALSLSATHLLVKLAKWCEHTFGLKADSNLCVTKAMQSDLETKWGIKATVLYDRPPMLFRQLTVEDKHDLFKKLATLYPSFKNKSQKSNKEQCETRFTTREDETVKMKDNRPALIVSSTSYTEDEDFSILLEALEMYETAAVENSELPKLVCVITGKGPMKEYYANKIAQKKFTQIEIIMPWLSAEDYPKLLASCDLGVSLHTSSSGLDLPMKVVDMFGCRLPVCAIDFNCLNELVKHDENGLVFHDSAELSSQMQQLFTGFPKNSKKLEKFRNNLEAFEKFRWDQCWDQNALPIFIGDESHTD